MFLTRSGTLIILQTEGFPSAFILKNLGFKLVGEFESFICNLES